MSIETEGQLKHSRNHDGSPITKSLFNKDFIVSNYPGVSNSEVTMFANVKQSPFKKPQPTPPKGMLIKAKTIELPAFEGSGP